MIVCRKPCTLYDFDLLGATGLVVIALATWWAVVAPWRQMWSEYSRLAAVRDSTERALQKEVAALDRFEQGLAQLEDAVASEADDVPRSAAYAQLLKRMTDAALDARLDLLDVSPQPIVARGPYLVSDVKLGGRGRSQDFIRFLDRLAQENPYQALQACSLTRAAQPDAQGTPLCELSWTVRLYLLPGGPRDAVGGGG
jgi:Tfp pilus assembly protein PilO